MKILLKSVHSLPSPCIAEVNEKMLDCDNDPYIMQTLIFTNKLD